MAVSLLGPVLVDGAGQLSRRDRVVLSALAVRSGDVLSAEQLADVLWGEEPPASWSKVVQGCVVRLRRAIGRDAVQTTSGGYRLALADDEIDLRRFEKLVGRARELAGRGEHDRAVALLTQALALWRGNPLCDVEGWPAGHTEAGRLEELRLSAQEALLVERAALGHDVVADASALVAAQPLREVRWHLLAVALYRAGRQSDALAALRTARQGLQDELGLDPGSALVELERAILTHDTDLVAPARAAPDTGVCPYQGLLVYDRGDADRFFGRDQETVACLRILRDCSLLVVAGPSGCGKSSLVRAGVIPRVERSGGKVVLITPGAQPLEALAGALATPTRDLVLVVDQLEELFAASHGPEVSTEFLERVGLLAESGHGVVLVVRADQLGGFARSPATARLVEEGLHLVTPMTRQELHEAIDGPARQAGLRLEPGLVELLVREVENEPGALPLLSHALVETWARREAGVLTVEGYRATGEIQGAVAQSAEAMWESQPVGARAEVRALLLRLVARSPDGEPAAARISLALVTGVPGGERTLDLLIRCRLVTTDQKTVTLAHEALARAWPRLRSWLDEDAAGHLLLRHLTVAAEDWQTRGRPDSELYRGARLGAALAWRARTTPSLTTLETDFLDASEALAVAEQRAARTRARRQRVALGATAFGLVLALVAGLVAVQQSRQSARTARTALVEQLVAQSVALRSTRRDLAELLAVQAYRLRRSAATRGALLGAFTASPGFLGYTPSGTTRVDRVPLAGGVFLPDGSLLAVGIDGVPREIDPGTGRTIGRFPTPDLKPMNARMDLSRDGRTLAVVSWEGPEPSGGRATLAVYDTASRRRRLPDTRLPLDVGAVAVSPTGRYVAVSGYVDGRVLIFDTQGRTQLPVLLTVDQDASGVRRLGPFGAAPDSVGTVRHTAALMFRPDGQLLTGSTSGVLRLVDPATGRETRRFAGAPGLTSNNTFTGTPDGRVVLSTGTAGVVRWDPATGHPLWVALIGEDRCGTAAVVGDQVLCGGRFGQVESLDLQTGSSTTARYDMQHGPVSDVLVSPDGRTLVELAGTQPVLARWRLDGTGPITRLLPITGTPIGYDASGQFLLMSGPFDVFDAVGDPHPVQRVDDSRTGALVYRADIVKYGAVWTARAGQLAAWDSNDQGHLVDVRTGRAGLELVSALPGSDGTYMAAGGGRLLAWSSSYAWAMWDVRTGDQVRSGSSPGSSGSTSRSGHLVVWSDGSQLWTVRISDGRVLARSSGFSAGADSPDGVVAASGVDGSLTFLDDRSLRPDGPALSDAPGTIEQYAFSRDGSLLAARGSDGNVRLIDMDSRTQLGQPIAVNGEGDQTIALRPDGRALAQPSRNGVLIWDLRPARWTTAACQLAGRDLSREEWRTYLSAVGHYQRTCPAST